MTRLCRHVSLLLVIAFASQLIRADIMKMFDESIPVLKPINRNATGNADIPTFVISGMKENKTLETFGKVQLLDVKPVPISQLLGVATSSPQYQLGGMHGARMEMPSMRGHFGLPSTRPQFGRGAMRAHFGRRPTRAEFGGLGLASLRGHGLKHGLRGHPTQIITEFEVDEQDAEEWLDKLKNMG